MSALTKDDGDVPAPWVVESDAYRVVVLDANGGVVADCTDGFDSDDGWVMAAKSEDVARLIASAPTMLEALVLAEAFISIATPEYKRDRDEAINEVLPAIRAAIAKATGGAK